MVEVFTKLNEALLFLKHTKVGEVKLVVGLENIVKYLALEVSEQPVLLTMALNVYAESTNKLSFVSLAIITLFFNHLKVKPAVFGVTLKVLIKPLQNESRLLVIKGVLKPDTILIATGVPLFIVSELAFTLIL
jgi:hypothetical protein